MDVTQTSTLAFTMDPRTQDLHFGAEEVVPQQNDVRRAGQIMKGGRFVFIHSKLSRNSLTLSYSRTLATLLRSSSSWRGLVDSLEHGTSSRHFIHDD